MSNGNILFAAVFNGSKYKKNAKHFKHAQEINILIKKVINKFSYFYSCLNYICHPVIGTLFKRLLYGHGFL